MGYFAVLHTSPLAVSSGRANRAALRILGITADQVEGIYGRDSYVTPAAGPTPFGFAVGPRTRCWCRRRALAEGPRRIGYGGIRLTAVTSPLMTGQRAAYWAVLTPSGRFGYASSAGTGNISGFAIARDGEAELLNEDGVTAVTGGNPTDMAMSADGRYLYARVAILDAIAVFRVGRDGGLTALPPLTGAPAGLAGPAGF